MRSHRKIFVFTILLAGISISVLAQPMYIGSDYYPNTSPKAQIEKDAELMKQAGFNVARLGDLVWDLMEPQEGQIGRAHV